jgi:GDPmannose 4,6-dehydratase
MKKAFITGVTGQDGSYLAELLLNKGYEVHGLIRRASTFNRERIEHLHKYHDDQNKGLLLHYGDVTDATSLLHILKEIEPDEVYHLAAQSHVQVSFEVPVYSADADAIGTLRLLEGIRSTNLIDKTKIYNASTSELFGSSPKKQNEETHFYARSPYAAAKLYAYWIAVNYREAYNMKIWNGILFNHESPRRGENFVTRKITISIAKILAGKQDKLYMGNMDAMRDWGYAPDYVEAMWMMLQQKTPDDFVIATGETHSVREFIEKAFMEVGISVEWRGSGVNEVGVDSKTNRVLIEVSPRYFRPTDVDCLKGDSSKAQSVLGWEPRISFSELVKIMVRADLKKEGVKLYDH